MECGLDNMYVGVFVACTTTRGDLRHDNVDSNRNERGNVNSILMTLWLEDNNYIQTGHTFNEQATNYN